MKISICMLALIAIVSMGCNGSQTTESEQSQASDSDVAVSEAVSEADDPVAAQDIRVEAQQTLETAEEFIAQEQKVYREQVAMRLDTIQQHVNALKQQLEKSPPTAGAAELQETFKRLEQQLADARQKSGQEAAETRETWTELKTAVDGAIDQLEASTQDARNQLDPVDPEQLESEKNEQEDSQDASGLDQ